LPGKASVEASLQRTFGYDPSLSWEILDIRASAIAGIPEVLVAINKQNPIRMYLTPDGTAAVIGELIPFGAGSICAGTFQTEDGGWTGTRCPEPCHFDGGIQRFPLSALQGGTATYGEVVVGFFPKCGWCFSSFPCQRPRTHGL
jgi:hypothetical protein